MKNCYIYFHINPITEEVFYVGKGTFTKRNKYGRSNDLKKRNKHHTSTIKKYGLIVNIIEDGLSEEESFEREKFYINKFGRRDLGTGILVNQSEGGDGGSPMLGKKHSDETRKKLSLTHKGKKMSEECRLKMSLANKGKKRKPMSEETKLKISESIKKKPPMSEETKLKISLSNKGKICSDETRKKLSNSLKLKHSEVGYVNRNIGKKRSEETKLKISLAVKKRKR